MIIWGKRDYGSVNKVGNVSVKTVFGHLYFLPLFPMASYYVDSKSKSFYELNRINWRSVGCAYVRMWLILPAIFALLMVIGPDEENRVAAGFVAAAMLAVLIGSYVYDRKVVDPQTAQLRNMMQRHFSLAVDPYECMENMQAAITQRMQAHRGMILEEHWHHEALVDTAIPVKESELAILRARCDQHDKELQRTALQQLARLNAAA